MKNNQPTSAIQPVDDVRINDDMDLIDDVLDMPS